MSAPVSQPGGAIGMNAALRCYQAESAYIRLFTLARHILAPLQRVADEVPSSGQVLDLGCGHGLFTNLLAAAFPNGRCLGWTLPRRRSTSRAEARPGLTMSDINVDGSRMSPNAAFELSRFWMSCTCCRTAELEVLKSCRRLVADDGVLLVKTNDILPRWKYAIVRLEEEVMVRLLGLTMGGELHFRGTETYLSLLQEAGFDAWVMNFDGWIPVPHRLSSVGRFERPGRGVRIKLAH